MECDFLVCQVFFDARLCPLNAVECRFSRTGNIIRYIFRICRSRDGFTQGDAAIFAQFMQKRRGQSPVAEDIPIVCKYLNVGMP